MHNSLEIWGNHEENICILYKAKLTFMNSRHKEEGFITVVKNGQDLGVAAF